MYFPCGNATDPIWRELASSQRNLLLNSLKPQHSNPNPKLLANQLWCIDFLTPPTHLIIPYRLPTFLESLMPLKNWCSIHARWSKSCWSIPYVSEVFFPSLEERSEKKLPWRNLEFYCISFIVQIAFLKFTSCDNQALVGCIPIAAVAVHLNLKSSKLVIDLIRCIAITYCIFKSLRQF